MVFHAIQPFFAWSIPHSECLCVWGNESERKTGWTRFVSYSQFHIYIYVALSVCVCVVFALHWVKRNKIIPIYVYVLPTAAATAVLDIA